MSKRIYISADYALNDGDREVVEELHRWYSTKRTKINDDVGSINTYSYLEHEFKQAQRKNKNIIIIYNSLYCMSNWLPTYMKDYVDNAHPFWKKNTYGEKVGDYQYIKDVLDYE